MNKIEYAFPADNKEYPFQPWHPNYDRSQDPAMIVLDENKKLIAAAKLRAIKRRKRCTS